MPRDDRELLEASKALQYDIDMLIFTYEKIRDFPENGPSQDTRLRDLYLECFLLHARSLIGFFHLQKGKGKRGDEEVKAEDYHSYFPIELEAEHAILIIKGKIDGALSNLAFLTKNRRNWNNIIQYLTRELHASARRFLSVVERPKYTLTLEQSIIDMGKLAEESAVPFKD